MLALLRAQERLRGRARLGSGRHGDPRRSPRRPPQQPRRQSQVQPQPRPGGEGGPCGSAPSAPVTFFGRGCTSQGLGDTPSALLLPHGHLCKAGWQPVRPPPPSPWRSSGAMHRHGCRGRHGARRAQDEVFWDWCGGRKAALGVLG